MCGRPSLALLSAVALSLLLLPTATIAQTGSQSSPTDVLYLVTASDIQTYDVDASTGSPTLYGTLSVPLPAYPSITPALDGHFIYVSGWDFESGATTLLVYATDTNGVPQTPPVQSLHFTDTIWNFILDPNGSFAYAGESRVNSQQETLAEIRLFTVNSQSGILVEAAKPAAHYPPDGPCNAGLGGGSFALNGFNFRGSQLYYGWGCVNPDGFSAPYYARQIDPQTVALGPDTPITGGFGSGVQFSFVNFTPIAILNDYQDQFHGSIENSVSVIPLTGGTPIFTCTFKMLSLCGTSGEIPDRSGNYLFFSTNQGSEITRLDLIQKQVVDLGVSIAEIPQTFSLDDKLIYGQRKQDSGLLVMPIYVFDPATGNITGSNQIPMPSAYSTPFPALRD